MALPRSAKELAAELETVGTSITAVDNAIAALPATPLEADLPDIVQVVADLSAATASLKTIVDTVAVILSTTRINQ